MKQSTQSRAATVAPATDSQHETRLGALRTDLESGRCGVLGAIALHPELTLTEIAHVAVQITKARNGGKS